MGVVYRGERVKLKRPVAIKFLSEGYAASDDAMRRFEVEARAMGRLSHPNCVTVTDFGLDHGAPYLVMDFITGRNLRQVLVAEGRLQPTRALAIIRQVLAGLAHAHAHSIIHRDLKPENILITAVEGHGEQVRIVDFGLAKLRDEGSVTTGVAVGTPGYMSPEQTVGEKVDERADVYAMGIILFELLVGQKPFQSPIIFEVLRMHREVQPPALDTVAPGLGFSAKLNAAVQRALAKQRDQRFVSASAFLAALEEVPEAQAQPELQLELPDGKRRVALWAAAAVLALAVLGGGVWAWRRSGRSAPVVAEKPRGKPPAAAGAKKRPDAPGTPRTPAASTSPGEADPGASDADAEDGGTATTAEDVAGNPDEPEVVRRLRVRAGAGDVAGAVRGLEALRKRDPDRAVVQYALGNLYAEMQSWLPAVKAYSAALTLEPAYRSDQRLIGDLVEALASDRAYVQATRLIRSELGKAALPRLEQAARSSTPRLRARARRLRSQLNE